MLELRRRHDHTGQAPSVASLATPPLREELCELYADDVALVDQLAKAHEGRRPAVSKAPASPFSAES